MLSITAMDYSILVKTSIYYFTYYTSALIDAFNWHGTTHIIKPDETNLVKLHITELFGPLVWVTRLFGNEQCLQFDCYQV